MFPQSSGLKSFVLWLVEKHLWIAICAVFAALSTFCLFQLAINWYLLCFLFFATIAEYSLNRPTVQRLYAWALHPLRAPNPVPQDFFTAVSAILSAVFLCFLPVFSQLFLLHCALIAIAYTLPFPGRKTLRQVPYLKMFLIVYAWVGCTFVVPLLLAGQQTTIPVGGLLERCLFFTAIALPFDVRDLKHDRYTGLKTLAGLLGSSSTRYLSLGLLGCCCLLSVLVWPVFTWSLAISYGITAAVVAGVRPGQTRFYSNTLVDGMLVLQGALLLFKHYGW